MKNAALKVIRKFGDLELLKEKIYIIYDMIDSNIPLIECDNSLEGDALFHLVGKSYREAVFLIGGELDGEPIFELLEEDAARYYLAAYLIDCLDRVEVSRAIFPIDNNPQIIGAGFFSMIRFLGRKDTILWIQSLKPFGTIIVDILDVVVMNAAFGFQDAILKEISSIRNNLLTNMAHK